MSIGTKSSTLSLTSALDWGGWSTPHLGRYPLYRWLGGHHSRSGLIRKISSLLGLDSRTVQPVPSRANPALRCRQWYMKYFVTHTEMFPTKVTDSNVPKLKTWQRVRLRTITMGWQTWIFHCVLTSLRYTHHWKIFAVVEDWVTHVHSVH
jgi:hypothetical protein